MIWSQPPRITSFLIKIASRCNLACDYCYMYKHADQSWRSQPALMSDNTIHFLVKRIAEYAQAVALREILLVFHGGEPLLAGAKKIVEITTLVRSAVPAGINVDATLQTNGTLLKVSDLELFREHQISVSISIDGDLVANDLHRLDHANHSTFDATLRAIKHLANYKEIYGGLICVIDPKVPPKRLLDFFSNLAPPNLDLLLPDANHLAPPLGRESDPLLYKTWLIQAFDLWFDYYPDMKIRSFDSVLETIVGLPSKTDAFGFGDISMLTIETDGTYHDLDVLKITAEGVTSLGKSLAEASILEVTSSAELNVRRQLLTLDGLAPECKQCPEVAVCGGGSVPHRFSTDGFCHPTIYCIEMLSLIKHARDKISKHLTASRSTYLITPKLTLKEVKAFDESFDSLLLKRLYTDESKRQGNRLLAVLDGIIGHETIIKEIRAVPVERVNYVAIQPSVAFWSSLKEKYQHGIKPKTIDGDPIPRHDNYIKTIHSWIMEGPPPSIRIHRTDEMLRIPFGTKIVFESGQIVKEFERLTYEAISLIGQWEPKLIHEIKLISPEIQFIVDTTADPKKAVSFSDNAVPGALYVSMRQENQTLSVYDLADSLIHEHRHQRLYLLQASAPLLTIDMPFIRSPWREDPRPPSGLFHAVYVFCGLLKWWQHVSEITTGTQQDLACREVESIMAKIRIAFPVLYSTALTPIGRELANSLESQFKECV